MTPPEGENLRRRGVPLYSMGCVLTQIASQLSKQHNDSPHASNQNRHALATLPGGAPMGTGRPADPHVGKADPHERAQCCIACKKPAAIRKRLDCAPNGTSSESEAVVGTASAPANSDAMAEGWQDGGTAKELGAQMRRERIVDTPCPCCVQTRKTKHNRNTTCRKSHDVW